MLQIVESVNELNSIYKELSNLVIIQGSLLDRIEGVGGPEGEAGH